MTGFERLLSPLTLGSRRLRNRVHVTAHTTRNIDADNLPDDRDVAYFAERARGGAALLAMGTTVVHPSSPQPYGVYANLDDRILAPYERLAAAVHEHGALIVPQLGHMAQRNDGLPGPVWSPSPVAYHGPGAVPHELTLAEIRELVGAFAAAASRAVRAGMDGVELAVGHGQLINLFCSPLTNRRNDAYGGSLGNRGRFALEIVEAVREAIGPGNLLGCRVNGSDLVDGSLDDQDWLDIDELLAATGLVDYLNVSVDFHGSAIPTMATEHGCWVPYAAAVKRRVRIPVACVGRITDPELAERILAGGEADLVGMTRAHIADPHLVGKLREGRRDDIRPCVGCVQMCIGELFRGRNVKCVYNPVTGYERQRAQVERERAPRSRRVVVVGGGPAGLEAARVAATRGHQVILLERSAELGGTLRLAAAPPTRAELWRIGEWLTGQVHRLGVDVRCGVEADADAVLGLEPDVVVVAAGALPALPPWARGLRRVVPLRTLLAADLPLAGTVAVVDDEQRGQGLVAAAYLADRNCAVTVLTDHIAVGDLLERETRHDLYRYVRARGVTFTPLTRCVAATENGSGIELDLEDTVDGERRSLAADWAVTTWARPDDRLLGQLRGRVEVHGVGDVLSPHRIEAAVHGAFRLAAGL